jgi:dTDP-4-amino-4,6-dideoxygalactose transaminase
MDLEKLKLICEQKHIKLIEDCAHAPGASYKSTMCGTFGDFSFFSFFSNKNLAVGEGGMVFSKDSILNEKIRLMRSHGMDRVTLERHLGRAISYDVVVPGLNYRADEIRAAIGREQLRKLADGNARRKEIYEIYVKLFEGSNVLPAFNFHSAETIAAYHIMPIILPFEADRDSVINELKNKGIQTSIHYPNFKEFKAYARIASEHKTPIVDNITSRTLTIPLHPRMTDHDAEKVARILLEVI